MMKRKGNIVTIALFVVAATLLSFSVVSSSRAALTYFSETYEAELSMEQIGVALLENDVAVADRHYLGGDDQWSPKDTGELVGYIGENDLVLGKRYTEELKVQNTGDIDQYVRVTIRKYWEQDGKKQPDLDPDLIDLELVNQGVWVEDTSAHSEERTVLYYQGILESGDTSVPFADALTIKDEPILASIESRTPTTDEDGGVTITTTYTYNGMEFVLEVDVDAVQTHNPNEAIPSAWGVPAGMVGA